MQNQHSIIYGKNAIEFVTVAAETCLFLENALEFDKNEFLDRALKLLPLLYLKTSMVEKSESVLDDELEDFVEEDDYEAIRQNIASVLGYADRYLEVFTKDIQLSEDGIASDISEDLADIYQDLKNFLSRYQIGDEEVMNEALVACMSAFREYWGQRLVNCLRALHNAFYTEADEIDEGNADEDAASMKKSFLSHQQGDDYDNILQSFTD
jgi:hypothetical protein